MLKESEIKEGDTVLLDGGFICREPGPVLIKSNEGELYFDCQAGKHYIDGQLDEDGVYVGLEKRN